MIRRLRSWSRTRTPSCCGHPMTWSTWAGGWVCGYCPRRA